MIVRFAKPDDSAALLKIYDQYIKTPITFECALPTEAEFSERIRNISKCYPYLVCEENDRIVGYAYANRHMVREAYQWNAELSVYLDPSFTSRGLGKKFYRILIEILKLQGVKTVYGCMTLPNVKSEALHEKLGFKLIGTYQNAGYKDGKWHDVVWFGKAIAQYDLPPKPIVPINHIREDLLQMIIKEE